MRISSLFRRKNATPSNRHQTTEVRPSARISNDTTMGKFCYVGDRSDLTKTTVENYVSIANNVTIGAGEHDLSQVSTSSLFYTSPYEVLTRKPCIVRSDAWIAVSATIRRGVTVGFGAVVGANSFVNQDVPNFAIVAGSPARVIRYRFSKDMQEIILDSLWWDHDIEEARQILAQLEKLPELGQHLWLGI